MSNSSRSSKKPINSVPMKTYAKIVNTASEGSVSNWMALRKQSGTLENLTKEEIKSEITKYEDAMTTIHNVVLRTTKDLLKQSLKNALSKKSGKNDEAEEEDNEEQPEEKSKTTKKRTRRPKTDVTNLGLDIAAPKKVEADEELTEKTDNLVAFLNGKYGTDSRSYKSEDSAKKTYIRIVRVDDDKEVTHCLIVKDDHERQREIKPKTSADGEATEFKTFEKPDHKEIKVYNADNNLITTYKRESVKKGDVLKSSTGTSPAPVPSVRGNIVSDYDNTVLKMSEYGINLDVVPEAVDASDGVVVGGADEGAAEVGAEAEVKVEEPGADRENVGNETPEQQADEEADQEESSPKKRKSDK